MRSADQSNREQIVEAMERSGLMASLVAAYGEGRAGLEALLVEQLAEGAAPDIQAQHRLVATERCVLQKTDDSGRGTEREQHAGEHRRTG